MSEERLTYKEIETKNGVKYHFYRGDLLIATVYVDRADIVQHTDLTAYELEEILNVVG